MVGGLVMKPKTTNKGKAMTRPTKDMPKAKTMREQMLALLTGDYAPETRSPAARATGTDAASQ